MVDEIKSCKTWTKFEVKEKDGSVLKLRIEDLPSDRIDDAVEFLVNNYMKEEAFQVAAGIYRNEEAVDEYRKLKMSLCQNSKMSVVMCCIDNDVSKVAGKIIGLSSMARQKNTEKIKDYAEKMELQTQEMKNLFKILIALEDITDDISSETYYSGRGIAVHRDYRSLGLANELVRVRNLVCIDQKIPMTCAWMTSIGSQKAAEKNDWKTLFEISPEKLEEITGLTFKKKVPSFKLMYYNVIISTGNKQNSF